MLNNLVNMGGGVCRDEGGGVCRDEACLVSTIKCPISTKQNCDISTSTTVKHENNKMSQISPKSKSLSTIIRSYKSACTNVLKQKDLILSSIWQPRFYDHIIRNEKELNIIRKYIKDNPKKWHKNKEKRNNIWF